MLHAGIFANLSIPPAAAINFDANYVPTKADTFGAMYFILDSIYDMTRFNGYVYFFNCSYPKSLFYCTTNQL